jgi:putative tricarboxylic transport membrane protein
MNMVERPYWIAAGVIAFGLVWLYQASLLPQFAQYAELGPGFTVTLIGAGLVLFGAILAFQIYRGVPFEAQEAEDVASDLPPSRSSLAFAAAGAGIPILTMTTLGFVITATASFVLTTRAFQSRRYVFNTVIGATFALTCWYGFRLLGVPLGGLLPVAGV